MKTIIIDDNTTSIEALAEKLRKYDDIELVGTANNGSIGINLTKALSPELVFLDVELPDMSGVDFLEQMSNTLSEKSQVVMYTGHSRYMLPAFRNNAFDYLLKPIDDVELDKIIQRVYANIRKSTPTVFADGITRHKDDDKLLFYTNSIDFRLVHIKDIGLFRYNHDNRIWEVVVACRDAAVKLKRSVNNETLLSIDKRFVQVSQKYIININYLLEVKDNYCHFYPPFDKIDYVSVGRFFRKKLIERFCAL